MAGDISTKDELAPLNIMEYTFSEKMLFVNTVQITKLSKTFAKIKKRDVKPYVLLALKEMEGQVPKVGGVADIKQYVAVRTLVHTIYREANLTQKYKTSYDEVFNYLISLKLSPESAHELLDSLFIPHTFAKVAKVIRLQPTIINMRWIIDLSYCQRNTNSIRGVKPAWKSEALRENLNVIILLQLSNGENRAIGIRWHELANFRFSISEALRSIYECEDKLKKREETTEENLRVMKAEGHF